MEKQKLTEIIKRIHLGDDPETALNEVIEKFNPLLNKYAHELKYDCAKSDLVIFLIQLIRNMDFDKSYACCEGQLVTYIARALKHFLLSCSSISSEHRKREMKNKMNEKKSIRIF